MGIGVQVIRLRMRGIGVEMWEISVGMWAMQEIRVGIWEIWVEMQGLG